MAKYTRTFAVTNSDSPGDIECCDLPVILFLLYIAGVPSAKKHVLYCLHGVSLHTKVCGIFAGVWVIYESVCKFIFS